MSLWFYAYFHTAYLFIIISSILFNYGIYLILQNASKANVRKIALVAGIAINIGILMYYKYMDFFILNINKVFHKEYALWKILLPLGISFFTFQQISFIVDTYKKEVDDYNLLYYASFVTFFPQLIAGPIVTHDELVVQFLDEKRKSIDWEYMAQGIYIFALGLAKKVLLADTFGNAVNWGYEHLIMLDSTNALVVMLAYTIQIYFDFSGYCDMAIGIGRMFHIDLPINFHSPYKAVMITEFWERWHITLTRFFTKYVYIPLGGSRRGRSRTYINTLIVFLASGFWHGASWSFVFWGMCHGIFMIITRRFHKFFERLHPALSWFITFGFVNVMWVFFRADSFSEALRFLKIMASCSFGAIDENILSCFNLPEITFFLQKMPIESIYPYFTITIFFVLSMAVILGCKNAYEKMNEFKPSAFRVAASAFLMLLCICSFSGISTFLYFNF
ncbi:MAG: MBOAT family protein [Bacillus sp. (in: Bacteria)]|nr:MBOAT family protein [Bacillus sp. (in: firmicutes)]